MTFLKKEIVKNDYKIIFVIFKVIINYTNFIRKMIIKYTSILTTHIIN